MARESAEGRGRDGAVSETKGKRGAVPSSPHDAPSDTSAAVNTYVRTLKAPVRREVEALRRLILAVDASIAEGIKWNAPSFRTSEYFATIHLRAKQGVGVILHLGAKAKDGGGRLAIKDPEGLLQWLADDRAMLTFADAGEIEARSQAVTAILRQWVRKV